MNLNSGNTSNGTSVISYSTDTEKNKTSQNRLWLIEKTATDIIQTSVEDINGDGTVDTQDILSIFDFIVQGKPVNATTIEDVNKDGLVDTQDVLSVYDYIIKH
jgi:hypothetical protein